MINNYYESLTLRQLIRQHKVNVNKYNDIVGMYNKGSEFYLGDNINVRIVHAKRDLNATTLELTKRGYAIQRNKSIPEVTVKLLRTQIAAMLLQKDEDYKAKQLQERINNLYIGQNIIYKDVHSVIIGFHGNDVLYTFIAKYATNEGSYLVKGYQSINVTDLAANSTDATKITFVKKV